jgi:DNA-binding MarR family transcriptional regulator
MSSATLQENRAQQIAQVSSQLLPRAALVTRLLVCRLDCKLARTEIGLLNTLVHGPRRITELAALERLAQPTMTQLVKRLEHDGLVARERQADDGRVVLVRLTAAGAAALEQFRTSAGAALGAHLAEMPDDEVEALATATETLARLVEHLQEESP